MYKKTLALLALVFFCPAYVSATSLYLDPDTGTFGPGDTFIVKVRLNADTECINAANVILTYPSKSMRAVDFGKGGSILSLWVTEPQIDTNKGTVTFAGGVPGGYCGRIQGDPSLTNVIGKVVFTVTDAAVGSAQIRIANGTTLYLNDGLGTSVVPDVTNAALTLVPEPTQAGNPWLTEVDADETPPDPFDVEIISTHKVFGGRHYAVFSTVDKQSGLDHYEMVFNGTWQPVSSPRMIDDQSRRAGIQVRAVDKAGNIRLGTYVEGSGSSRKGGLGEYGSLAIIFLILVGALIARHYLNKRKAAETIDLRS